ncbi:probable methyltransferase-like protein 25 isoform X2 [Lepisosteus oculatus]|uniref:probable methyltransferase-like protein 25 isoform X2 n=1 Tax=Lepisosteus oculatus TaxID=7918 RepID=UPI0037109A35
MSSFLVDDIPLEAIWSKLDAVKEFLTISLKIANAHTVDFYTRGVWSEFIAVPPERVLSVMSNSHERAPLDERFQGRGQPDFGFSEDRKHLVDVARFLHAAKAHSLPNLLVCTLLNDLMQMLNEEDVMSKDEILNTDEFMNSKKSHEVQVMSEVIAGLARYCRVCQVIDIGSGKGYLCSFLSMQYGLKVYGIDSSNTNTHGAQERNRKLKKYSKTYQRHSRTSPQRQVSKREEKKQTQEENDSTSNPRLKNNKEMEELTSLLEMATLDKPATSFKPSEGVLKDETETNADTLFDTINPEYLESANSFLGVLSPEIVELPSPRIPPSELSNDEKERRKHENLKKKAKSRSDYSLYSPLTSFVTAETELRDIIEDMEDSVMVGLHTCGDLAPSMLRMFVSKSELKAVCSVGCCYHLLSEEFDCARQENPDTVWGFPLSQYMRQRGWYCGRNARMSACLALERVAVGQGLPIESLFYRAVLHVILRDHYGAIKSEKRVGNVYSKTTSFVDYIKKALKKLDLDESKLSDSLIQDYYETFKPRMKEMEAFNMLKVALAPCIEGLILLDRLCYLKEQEEETGALRGNPCEHGEEHKNSGQAASQELKPGP